ncbi:hypothetical protein FOXYSP1_14972 [Fusarium oxysporum f. sp. phaseoli]
MSPILPLLLAVLGASLIALALAFWLYVWKTQTRKKLEDTELGQWNVHHIYLIVPNPRTWTKKRNIAHGHAKIEDPKDHCIYNLYSAIAIKGLNRETNELHDSVELGMDAVVFREDGEMAAITGVILDERLSGQWTFNLLVKMGLPVVPIPVDPLSLDDSPTAIKAPWVTFSRMSNRRGC